jgi:UDP-glucuronate 4-epimerase
MAQMRPAIELPQDRPVLVTGAAGFIGFHVCRRLAMDGFSVVGIDNLNDYYDPELKKARLAELGASIQFRQADIEDGAALLALFERTKPLAVVHLAAQAGVRYSLENPTVYVRTNVLGFLNVLEACRANPVAHLVAASSSSVYGMNANRPYSEADPVERPVSLYAATKRADELMANTYSHLFGIPTTCLRFFTVYGPWGRPDMAYYSFTRLILGGRPIPIFNDGKLKRDFTFIDDIVDGVLRVLVRPPENASLPNLYNIGNHRAVELLRFVEILEDALGRTATLDLKPMQPGDVLETYADIERIKTECGFEPKTPLEEGLPQFVDWFRTYHGI